MLKYQLFLSKRYECKDKTDCNCNKGAKLSEYCVYLHQITIENKKNEEGI